MQRERNPTSTWWENSIEFYQKNFSLDPNKIESLEEQESIALVEERMCINSSKDRAMDAHIIERRNVEIM